MRITYDRSIDAAYIYFIDVIEKGWVGMTYPCDPKGVNGTINLDFDREGRLGGIEVLNASHRLPKSVLDKAEIIGKNPKRVRVDGNGGEKQGQV